MHTARIWTLALSAALFVACGGETALDPDASDDAAPVDAGAVDAGDEPAPEETPEAAPADAGDMDATTDAGLPTDAGPCPRPTSGDDGSIVPPPRPCDSGMPPPH